MTWLDKLLPPRIKRSNLGAKRVPEGLWVKCPACDSVLYGADLESSLSVCPKCGHHLRMRARRRTILFATSPTRRWRPGTRI